MHGWILTNSTKVDSDINRSSFNDWIGSDGSGISILCLSADRSHRIALNAFSRPEFSPPSKLMFRFPEFSDIVCTLVTNIVFFHSLKRNIRKQMYFKGNKIAYYARHSVAMLNSTMSMILV